MNFEDNLKLQRQEFKAGKLHLKCNPSQMAIVFGNNCNLRCRMCGCKGYYTRLGIKKTSRLNERGLKDAMTYFPYIDLLFLSGGEPLMYKEFKQTVEVAAKHPNLKLKVLTNGNLINDFWIEKLKELSGDVPYIIVGNKTDLKREIDKEIIESKLNSLGVKYFETSAKLNENVDEAFESLSVQILNTFR